VDVPRRESKQDDCGAGNPARGFTTERRQSGDCGEGKKEMTTRAAVALGAVFATAITVSIFRRPKYPSFKAWWDAEGLPIWMTAGFIGGGLYFGCSN
jgi:hypothetical protein